MTVTEIAYVQCVANGCPRALAHIYSEPPFSVRIVEADREVPVPVREKLALIASKTEGLEGLGPDAFRRWNPLWPRVDRAVALADLTEDLTIVFRCPNHQQRYIDGRDIKGAIARNSRSGKPVRIKSKDGTWYPAGDPPIA